MAHVHLSTFSVLKMGFLVWQKASHQRTGDQRDCGIYETFAYVNKITVKGEIAQFGISSNSLLLYHMEPRFSPHRLSPQTKLLAGGELGVG